MSERWRWLLIAACAGLLWVGASWAESMAERYVTGFDGEDVEAFRDGRRVIVPVAEVGAPPIPILEQNDKGFVKVKAASGEFIWLRRGDLITDAKASVPRCNEAAGLTYAEDRTMAGMRGVGEGCR